MPKKEGKVCGRKRKGSPLEDSEGPQAPTPPPPSDYAVSDFFDNKGTLTYEELEKETVDQHDSEVWHLYRHGRVTGTSAPDILSADRQACRQNKNTTPPPQVSTDDPPPGVNTTAQDKYRVKMDGWMDGWCLTALWRISAILVPSYGMDLSNGEG